MRKTSALIAVAVAVLAWPLAGCDQLGNLKARKAFKDANALYQKNDFREAVAHYEEALKADPDLVEAYFFLGNSYDNLYKPARRGEEENDRFLEKAVENYKLAAEREQDPERKKLALEYLVAAYGPDKLNDPAQAEPIVQRIIDMDPSDPNNYFVLAKIYEDAGNYEKAEATLQKAREVRPQDPNVYMQTAGYYNRQGDFDKTMEALHDRAKQEPENPEAYYTIATYYWEKAYKDHTLKDAQKKEYLEKGIEAADKALELKDDYVEALTYKNLLLRTAATVEKNPQKQQELLKEANALREKAMQLQKKKGATTVAGE